MIVSDIEWVNVSGDAGVVLAKYPVTVRDFSSFIEAGGYSNPAYWSAEGWRWIVEHGINEPCYWGEVGYAEAALPVTGISFWEAEAAAAFFSAQIPTESSWEFAASNGGKSLYPWGDSPPNKSLCHLSFDATFGSLPIKPVDSYIAGESECGMRDMIGNVSEWCRTSIASEYVLKGGCRWHSAQLAGAKFRDILHPGTRDNQTGFRLCKGQLGEHSRHSLAEHPGLSRQTAQRLTSQARTSRPTFPFRQEGLPSLSQLQGWYLTIQNGSQEFGRFSLDDLREELREVVAKGIFVCVCKWADINTVKGWLIRDLVEIVGVDTKALPYLKLRSMVGPTGKRYESTVVIDEAVRNGAMLCHEMDGKPLSNELVRSTPVYRLSKIRIQTSKRIVGVSFLRFVFAWLVGEQLQL